MNKVFIVLFSLVCIYTSYNGDDNIFSLRVYLSSLLIQIFSIVFIFSSKERPFTLHKMFYLFNLFFLGVAPIQQFYSRSAFFGARLLFEYEYFFLNLLIIAILITYQLLYGYFLKLKLSNTNINTIANFDLKATLTPKKLFILLLLSIFSFSVIFYFNNYNFLSMLVRGGAFKEQSEDIESSTIMLIINQTIRPLSFISLLYYISTKTKSKIWFFVFGIIAIVTCSPLGMPRFAAAAMYIPFSLLLIPALRKRNVFSLVLMVGLLIVFPFLDNFRNFSEDAETNIGLDMKMFSTGNFDSYQNFALILSENIITWGRQLLGVLFFWVPRSIWPDKPIGSGATMAEKLHFEWTNVSANYFAEGYINFGYLGIVLFIFLIAFFNAKLDNMYWRSAAFKDRNFFKVIYFVFLGMMFFILRGDLLSSFAFTIGYLISAYIVFKAVN